MQKIAFLVQERAIASNSKAFNAAKKDKNKLIKTSTLGSNKYLLAF
ncbi:hypothetical protein LJB93_01120 [Desulfovibrio sp. OttesenSCG-928-F07]|nr:hypothetical protein [Desulfovibrio sp. OttesenSCG-928-F07]